MDSASSPDRQFPAWCARGRVLTAPGRTTVMGILNVTPDSFSDGGRADTPERAVARARELVREGAAIVDIGGESTRPGADPVPVEEELRRVVPVVVALAGQIEPALSIDTSKAAVARAALAAGAHVINDVTALGDPEMADAVAESGAGVILMHSRGTPRTMQLNPRYENVVAEVLEFLAGRIDLALSRGIGRDRIAIDPGIGFGKTFAHNLQLLRNLERFASLGCALVVGTSRKAFLGRITGREVGDRQAASVASALAAAARGAQVVRVHDVAPTVDALKVWHAQMDDGDESDAED